jgi:hypothetical protein
MLLRGNLTGIKVQASVHTMDEAPSNEENGIHILCSGKYFAFITPTHIDSGFVRKRYT